MDLKETIIKRKSIRKYTDDVLSGEELAAIDAYIKSIQPILEGEFTFKFANKTTFYDVTSGKYRVAAPHYIMFYGDKTNDDVSKNIGYVGQMLCLYLADKNIGSCWIGSATSKTTEEEKGYIVSIAFGKTNEQFRQNAGEAKRKMLNKIAVGYSADDERFLNSVRLAPSAMNFQPWFFEFDKDTVHVFRKKPALIFMGFEKMQKIDIGIAIAHFNVLKEFKVFKEEGISRSGYIYECTLSLK